MRCHNPYRAIAGTALLLLVGACGNPSSSVSADPDDTSTDTARAVAGEGSEGESAAAPDAATAGPILVTRFLGTPSDRYRAGQTIDPDATITLAEGERLWLRTADGSRILTGPGRYTAGADAPLARTGALDSAERFVDATTNDEGNSTTAAVRRTILPPGSSGGVRGPATELRADTPRVTADMVRPEAPAEVATPEPIRVRPRGEAVARQAADPSIVEQARGE